ARAACVAPPIIWRTSKARAATSRAGRARRPHHATRTRATPAEGTHAVRAGGQFQKSGLNRTSEKVASRGEGNKGRTEAVAASCCCCRAGALPGPSRKEGDTSDTFVSDRDIYTTPRWVGEEE